jgi:cobalt-zinc-cadmium efflux system outer membrane protein
VRTERQEILPPEVEIVMLSRIVPLFVVCVLPVGAARAAQPPATGTPPQQVEQVVSDVPGFYAPDPALAGYVRAALDANPAVQAGLQSYRAALERVHVASALPDPTVSFSQAIEPVQTRVGPQLNTLMLTQPLPWRGKLDLRGKVAAQEAAAAFEAYRAQQREVIAQVKKAFYDLGYIDNALAIAREEQSLLGHYEQVAQARYAQGQGLQQAVIKIQAEITKVANRLQTLQQQRETQAARLNTLMNRATGQPVPAVAPPSMPPDAPLDMAQLEAVGEAERPEIKAADALVGRGERMVELAKQDTRPDFTVGAGFVNVGNRRDAAGIAQPPPDNGRNAISVTLGITLPIWRGKNRADLQRAADALSAAQLERANAHNEMALAVRDQVVRLQTLREQVRLVSDVLLPQTDEALRSTESAYETGQVGMLDLLDSERNRLEVRLIRARDIADYLVALANLERAVGAPFPEATRIP